MEGVKRIDFIVQDKCFRRRFRFTFDELEEEAGSLVESQSIQLFVEGSKRRIKSQTDYDSALRSAPLSGLRLEVKLTGKGSKTTQQQKVKLPKPIAKSRSTPEPPHKKLAKSPTKTTKAEQPLPKSQKKPAKKTANSAVKAVREPEFPNSRVILATNTQREIVTADISREQIKHLPNSQIFGSGRCLRLASSNQLIYTGGSPNKKDCCLMNLDTGAVVQKCSLLQGRHFHGMAECRLGIIVIGGTCNDTVLSSCEVFNENKWTQGPPMNVPRSSVTAATVNDKVYAVGGKISEARVYTSEIEVLDGVWSIIPVTLPIPVISVGVAGWEDLLVVFGGQNTSSVFQSSTLMIDTKSFSTTQCADMPYPSKYPTTHAETEGDQVFCIAKLQKEAYIFNARTRTWDTLRLYGS
mmetsp:Transcript_9002/g.17377  ORF Transcript_9002/g.17377 Transcript_9002/m.17377 type:complete len:409 (+) Transcript_9002:16-1242(+)